MPGIELGTFWMWSMCPTSEQWSCSVRLSLNSLYGIFVCSNRQGLSVFRVMHFHITFHLRTLSCRCQGQNCCMPSLGLRTPLWYFPVPKTKVSVLSCWFPEHRLHESFYCCSYFINSLGLALRSLFPFILHSFSLTFHRSSGTSQRNQEWGWSGTCPRDWPLIFLLASSISFWTEIQKVAKRLIWDSESPQFEFCLCHELSR